MSSPSTPPDNDALPVGTRLGEFEIERVVGVGGFGIVYLAMDHALQRRVALKEYMPSALAARGSGTEQISIRSSSHAETFGIGLRSFVNEARLLAKFDNPSLVKVHRFWEANGTAYMVMPYYQGLTLKDARPSLGGAPSEAWLRTMLDSVLGALELIHHEQIYHRDVSPPNIMLVGSPAWDNPRELKPVLLDFGAARHVIGDRTQTLTAILNPSFAPIEQYAESTALRQGPWTDLYALAGVVYFCLTGRPPVQAAARTIHDELRSLGAQQATLRSASGEPYSLDFLRAIDWCLCVKPNQRPDSVQSLREVLAGQRPVPAHVVANEAQSGAPEATMGATNFPPTQPAGSAYARTEADMPTRVMPPTGNFAATQATPAPAAPAPAPKPAPQAAPAPKESAAKRAAAPAPAAAPSGGGSGGGSGRMIGIGAAVAAVVAVAGFGAWKFTGGSGATPEVAAASAPAASAMAPVVTPAVTPVVEAPVATASVPASAPEPAPVAVAPAATPEPPVAPPVKQTPAQTAAARPATKPAPLPTLGRDPKPRPGDTPTHATHAPEPVPAQQQAPVAPVAQSPQPAAPASPVKPPEICSKRVLFSYDLCMTRECKKPEYADMAQCSRFKGKSNDPTSIN